MKWLMIIAFVTVSGDSGVSITTAQFQTKELCEAAGTAAQHNVAGWTSTIRYVCVEAAK